MWFRFLNNKDTVVCAFAVHPNSGKFRLFTKFAHLYDRVIQKNQNISKYFTGEAHMEALPQDTYGNGGSGMDHFCRHACRNGLPVYS